MPIFNKDSRTSQAHQEEDKHSTMVYFAGIAYRLFGDLVNRYFVDFFRDLQVDLRKAMIPLTLTEYLSLAVGAATFMFFFQTLFLSILFTLLFKSVLFGVFGGVLGGVVFSILTFIILYMYPTIIVGERKKNIDDTLPFATLYMATMVGTGAPLVSVFKMLSRFKEYGEVAREAKRIVDAVEITGAPITRVLEDVAERTPSEAFRELLWGIKSTITIGGDLRAYLYEKARGFVQEYRRRLASYTNQLMMFLEIYINAVIIGVVFFVILTSVIGILGVGASTIIFIHYALIFVLLPVATVATVLLIRGIQPASA